MVFDNVVSGVHQSLGVQSQEIKRRTSLNGPSAAEKGQARKQLHAALGCVKDGSAQAIVESFNADHRLFEASDIRSSLELIENNWNQLDDANKLAILSSDLVSREIANIDVVKTTVSKSLDFLKAESGSVEQHKAFAAVVPYYMERQAGTGMIIGNQSLKNHFSIPVRLVYETMMGNDDFSTNLAQAVKDENGREGSFSSYAFQAKQAMTPDS